MTISTMQPAAVLATLVRSAQAHGSRLAPALYTLTDVPLSWAVSFWVAVAFVIRWLWMYSAFSACCTAIRWWRQSHSRWTDFFNFAGIVFLVFFVSALVTGGHAQEPTG